MLELNKRNLNSVGTIAEFKNRLLKFNADHFVTIN